MEDFTIRNFLKQWKAILPLAIIFTFVGLMMGLFYNTSQQQKYSILDEVLVLNTEETTMPEDLVAIANSELSVGDKAKKAAEVDQSCDYKATKSGNVVKITTTCSSSAEDTSKLAKSIVSTYNEALKTIYDNEDIEAKVITHGDTEELVTLAKRILFVTLPALAGLALSAFIAFIKLDHITSKKRK